MPKTVSVVVNTPGWFGPFALDLVAKLEASGHRATFVVEYADVPSGDIAFFLSCTEITPPEVLARNGLNLVVHASDLPRGRGFSPLVWQILDGQSDIPLTMITMASEVDAGDVVMQRWMRFDGHELNEELRGVMGREIVAMCLDVARQTGPVERRRQQGEPSWFRRRRPDDSKLDVHRSIANQFDLFRVVDNERYPAFFEFRGHRYKLRIEDLGPVEAHNESNQE